MYVEKIKSDKSLVSEKVSDYIAVDIARCLKINNCKNLKENSKFFSQPWLYISYIAVKCLYGISIIFQIWFMSYIFQDEYNRGSGIGFFETSLTIEERFPRVIFCKIDIKTLYDFQRHWVQCVLPDNIYIEKVHLLKKNF